MNRVSVSALTRACYAGIFVAGIFFAMLGSILPLLLETQDLNMAQAGALFSFLSMGSLVAVLVAGPVLDRTGYKATLLVAPCLIATSLVLLNVAQGYPTLAFSCSILGLGGGALNIATNSFVSDLHPQDRTVALNRLGMFFCIGAIFMPSLIGSLLTRIGLGLILLIVAVAALAPAVAFLFLNFPAAKQPARIPASVMLRTLANPFVLLMGLLLFFQSGAELSTSGWITSFFTSVRGLENHQAAGLLAFFWLTVMVARLLVGVWLKRIPEILFVFLSGFGAALSWLLLLYSRRMAIEVLAVCLLAFSLAGIFPTCLSIAGARFPNNSGAVFGALFAVATLGGMTIPAAVGQVAERGGIVKGMSILPLCAAAVCVLARRVDRAK